MNEPGSGDWERIGRHIVEWLGEWLVGETRNPIIGPTNGADLAAAFDEPLPLDGRPLESVLSELEAHLLPGARKNGHPGFMAYVSSSADPVGALADLIASVLNQNVTSWRSAPAAATIERQTLAWLDQAIGFGGDGHGCCLSGGSAANFHAIALAISRAAHRTGDRRRLSVYWTHETHLSMPKAARTVGIQPEHIRVAPETRNPDEQVAWIERQLAADRHAGLVPCLICGTAGTAGTGTIEPLEALADLAAAQDVWFHVDGAYGAPAAMLEEYHCLRRAFGRADSISIDPHKWLFAPLDIACLLVRDAEATTRAFSEEAHYTQVLQSDPVESFAFFDHSLELSRRFRALKLWMILKVRGARAIAAVIRRNIELRERLDQAVSREPCLEPMASGLSISCFRYLGTRQESDLDALNEALIRRLNEAGAFHLSPNRVAGKFTLRICIVNFRTRTRDIDRLLQDVLRLGASIEAS